MKKNLFLNAVMTAMLFVASCSKPPGIQQPEHPPPAEDKRNVQLKDVLIDHLPSPYFHFIYNDSGFVSTIGFASDFFTYDVAYENKRVKKMTNTRGTQQLLYTYTDDGRVGTIKSIDRNTSTPRWHFEFTYYNNTQLSQIRWFAFNDNGKDSLLQRSVLLLYHPDGNLAEFSDYRRDAGGQFLLSRTVSFNNYDHGTNVDDFYLLKDFFDDVLFLPQVKFQKNNPKQVISKGVTNDYTTDYTYQYNAGNLPVTKTTHMVQTRGPKTGEEFTGSERFTYY